MNERFGGWQCKLERLIKLVNMLSVDIPTLSREQIHFYKGMGVL